MSRAVKTAGIVAGRVARALAASGRIPGLGVTALDVSHLRTGVSIGQRSIREFTSLPLEPAKLFTTTTDVSSEDEKIAIALEDPRITTIRKHYLRSQRDIIGDLNAEIADAGLDRSSIEAGHKIIAMRSTLLTRLYLELQLLFDDPVSKLRDKIGKGELLKKIKENKALIRATGHPTEGNNLPTIIGRDLLIKTQTFLTIARHLNEIAPDLLEEALPEITAELANIARKIGLDTDLAAKFKAEERLPTIDEVEEMASAIREVLVRNFVRHPIHHTSKMTVQDERHLLLEAAKKAKIDMAKLASRYEEIDTKDIDYTSWALDMDGKSHIESGDGSIFEYQSKEIFFESLLEMLQTKKDQIQLSGGNYEAFEAELLARILEIRDRFDKKLLVGKEATTVESEITATLEEFEEINEIELIEIKNFVKGSGCKVMQNGYSTREEIDKTRAAFVETIVFYFAANPDIAEEIGVDLEKPDFDQEDLNKMATYVMRNSGDEEMMEIIASQFGDRSPETQRQLMMMIESASLHENHEHVISQFSCEVGDYKAVIALFEIAKHLPKYHEAIPSFSDHYATKSAEAGLDIYAELFSDEAIARASESMVEPSPLAENRDTIPLIVPFTAKMLADPDIVDYTRRAGGKIRQTRSKSDGSASAGPDEITILYLEANSAVEKMVTDAGFEFHLLQGIGANDLERMAPWNLDLLMKSGRKEGFTAQGGDLTHQTMSRLLHLLLRNEDKSEDRWAEFKEKYAGREDEIRALIEFYYENHQRSEEGIPVEIGDRVTKSGFLTHRGPIPAKVGEYLGRLSSRPGARKGEVKDEEELPKNRFNEWHELVYAEEMRRIGAISLQRSSGYSTFVVNARSRFPKDFDPEMVYDFHAIPQIRNNDISAIFALGCIDIESFMLSNGLEVRISDDVMTRTAEIYEQLLILTNEGKEKEADELTKEMGFDTPEGMRAGHLFYQINNAKFALRNAVTPMAMICEEETKARLEEIFEAAESGTLTQSYNEFVQQACEALVLDSNLDLETKTTLACASQQIANVRRPGNFYDTRAKLIREAHEALEEGDKDRFEKACEQQAIITRSAGNPLSSGRKIHELSDYFEDTILIKSPAMFALVAQMEAARKVTIPAFEYTEDLGKHYEGAAGGRR